MRIDKLIIMWHFHYALQSFLQCNIVLSTFVRYKYKVPRIKAEKVMLDDLCILRMQNQNVFL